MSEQWTENERLAFCKKTSDCVMEALDKAWHDGMKIGKEHQAGFQNKIAELEANNKELKERIAEWEKDSALNARWRRWVDQ